MRDRVIFVLGLTLLLLLGCGAVLGGEMDFSTVGVGFYGSYRDFNDYGDTMGGGGRVWWTPLDFLGIDFRVGYYEKAESDAVRDAVFRRTKFRVMPVEVGISLNWAVGGHVRVFGGGGVGYYTFHAGLEAEEEEQVYINTEDVVGGFAFGGAMVEFTEQLWLFAEARYTWLDADVRFDYDDERHDFDLDASGPGVNVGLVFGF